MILTWLELSPRTADLVRDHESSSSCFAYKDAIMVWQVGRHHASHYVTNGDYHSYFDNLDICYYCCDCGCFDAEVAVIAARYYYRVHAPRMSAGKTVYIPRSVSVSRRSTRCCICVNESQRKFNIQSYFFGIESGTIRHKLRVMEGRI